MELEGSVRDNPKPLIVGLVFLIAVLLYAYYDRYIILPREGNRYTIARVNSRCYTSRGDGYILVYTVEGKEIVTRCDRSDMDLTIGKKYLVEYSKVRPTHYRVLYLEQVDSVEAPAIGWTEIPVGQEFK